MLWKRALQYLLTAIVTLFFLYLTFRGADVGRLIDSVKNANFWWIMVAVTALIASDYVRGLRWGYMLQPVKSKMSPVNLFSSVMIGYLLNNVLPRAGEISRSYALARLENVSVSSVLAATFAERLLDVMTLIVLLLILPLVQAGPLRELFPWLEDAEVFGVVGAIVVLGFLFIAVTKRGVAERGLRRALRWLPARASARLEGVAVRFIDGLMFLRSPSVYLPIAVLTISIWLLYLAMTYAGFVAFGLDAHLGGTAALVVLTISTIGMAIPTPGGTGTYHFFVLATLVGLFGMSREASLGYATVVHGASFLGSSLFGIGFLLKDQERLSQVWNSSRRE